MGLAKEDEGGRWVRTASTVPTSGSQPLDPHLHPRTAQFAIGGWINHDPLTTDNFPSVLYSQRLDLYLSRTPIIGPLITYLV